MNKLTRNDLLSLEQYAAQRAEFRARAIEHKRARTLHPGAHLTLIFEGAYASVQALGVKGPANQARSLVEALI